MKLGGESKDSQYTAFVRIQANMKQYPEEMAAVLVHVVRCCDGTDRETWAYAYSR